MVLIEVTVVHRILESDRVAKWRLIVPAIASDSSDVAVEYSRLLSK